MTSTLSQFTTSTVSSTVSPSCTSAVPDKNGYVPYDACGANYLYYPSFGAALVFAISFGLSLAAHSVQAFYYKKWKLCWVIIMGVLWEFAAFILRTFGSRKQQVETYPLVSTLLILLAPIWINAFVYMVLGRMIYFFVPDQQIWGIKAIKIAKMFVWLDIIAFLVQAGGGILINPDVGHKIMTIGIHTYMAGIGLQEFFILIFTAVAIKFHRVMLSTSSNREILPTPNTWRHLLYTLYSTLILITIRVMFRMAEFSKGVEPSENPLLGKEAYFMVLDALPVLLACVLLNFVHPGRILKGDGSEFPKGPTRKQKREIKKVKKMEKRARKEERKAHKAVRKGGKNGFPKENLELSLV